GRHRVAAEPKAVADIVALCGRLPLALVIVAARALAHPDLALGTLAAQLAGSRRGTALDGFTGDDPSTDPRAVFSWSYRTLTPPATLLFRLLGLTPGPDIWVRAAASLVALPPAEAAALLAELADAALITEYLPGRYALHDLLRAYAADLALRVDPEDTRHAALIRLFDHQVHAAHAAAGVLDPNDDAIPVPLAPPAAGVAAERFADQQQATAWLAASLPVLQAGLRSAAGAGFPTHAWQLAWSLDTYLFRSGHRHDRLVMWQTALRAAEQLDDPGARALAHRRLANASVRLGRTAEALDHNHHALALYRQTGDGAGLASVHYNLTHLWERLGRHANALDDARQALTLYRAAGHHRGQALAHNAVGWYSCLLGDHAGALASCRRALDLFRQINDPHGEASTCDSLGYAEHHLGHHTEALIWYHDALRLYRRLASRYDQATVLLHLGDTLRVQGDASAARAALSEAAEILTDLEHPEAVQARARIDALGGAAATVPRTARRPARPGPRSASPGWC
ncbi:MAG TPA: tetratricopeptide repeat protein, partial [Rugosimonospora sp.]|nr:tetratricopeptide repeat protein [Rugosimonospora sp.]